MDIRNLDLIQYKNEYKTKAFDEFISGPSIILLFTKKKVVLRII